jgi:hypothetical protein
VELDAKVKEDGENGLLQALGGTDVVDAVDHVGVGGDLVERGVVEGRAIADC